MMNFPFSSLNTGWTVRALTLASILAASMLTAAHGARADAITLGGAANYGLLIGTNETLTVNGLNLTGNIGVAANDKINLSGSATVSGTAYMDSGVATSGGGSASVSGGIVTQSMTSIVAAAAAASTAAGALTGTAGMVDQGGSISLNGNSIVIKAVQNASENVLNISSLSLTNGTITFDDNGYTNAKFIINVTGSFSTTNGAVIKGINGASADDIIFNIEGTGTTVNLTGNSSTSIIGTILAPQRNVNLGGGGSLTGALIAGVNNAGKSYTVNQSGGGYNINSLGFTPYTGGSTNTPEPSSIALFGAGISALIAARRRQKR
jgi:choice-of-anchor A domain-containing protein